MRIYLDRRGRIKGYSMSPLGWLLLLPFLLGLILFPFFWPLVVFHGTLGIVLTVIWDLAVVPLWVALRARKD